ncbi:hypothetical protein AAE478_002305 [Parahypoxylon ruwenzoriense]
MFRSIPYRHARPFQTLASFLAFCILLSTLRLYRQQTPYPRSIYDYTDGKTRGARLNETSDAGTRSPPSDETTYLRYLVREYGLSNEVPFFARRIQPRFDAYVKESMTVLSTQFMSRDDFQRVRVDNERLNLHAEEAARVSVIRSTTPDRLDASSLLFGISTSYDRLTYANGSLIGDWARWLTDGKGNSNGASLVLTLHRAGRSDINYVSSELREVGIDAVVLPAESSSQDSTARYLDLMRLVVHRRDELLREEGREKKFLALVDDDVFFPSLGKLLATLSKYDAAKKLYLGLPSERSDWTVENNITLTYGGGAVFFSPPMSDVVVQLPCINGTAQASNHYSEIRTGQWDEALYNCVTTHTDEKLYILPSLYAPGGDESNGLPRTSYDDGVQALTLHHYRHRHRFEPSKAHLVTSLCGEACFLQRFFFRADGWILVNGHSISQYPDGVDVLLPPPPPPPKSNNNDGQRGTRIGERLVIDKDVEFEMQRRRVVSWAGTKRTWRLLDARAGPRGEVWQAYVKRRGPSSAAPDDGDGDTVHTQDGPSDVDSVIVLIWEPAP